MGQIITINNNKRAWTHRHLNILFRYLCMNVTSLTVFSHERTNVHSTHVPFVAFRWRKIWRWLFQMQSRFWFLNWKWVRRTVSAPEMKFGSKTRIPKACCRSCLSWNLVRNKHSFLSNTNIYDTRLFVMKARKVTLYTH